MSLQIILGSMFSGKSTELIRRLNILAEMDLRVIYLNHNLDSRGKGVFSTHNPTINSIGKIQAQKISSFNGIDLKEFDVIGIDEAQFIPKLYVNVRKLVDEDKKQVIVAGLDGDFNRDKFGEILDLIPICDSVVKLTPFCKSCWQKERKVIKALFSKRLTKETDVVQVGAADIYTPSCRVCFFEKELTLKEG